MPTPPSGIVTLGTERYEALKADRASMTPEDAVTFAIAVGAGLQADAR